MNDKPLELIREGDRIVGVRAPGDRPYDETFKEWSVTLLRKECIRLWRVVWESDGESNNGNLDTFQRAAKLREAQMAWERVVDLEAKIERYLRTGEWSE